MELFFFKPQSNLSIKSWYLKYHWQVQIEDAIIIIQPQCVEYRHSFEFLYHLNIFNDIFNVSNQEITGVCWKKNYDYLDEWGCPPVIIISVFIKEPSIF